MKLKELAIKFTIDLASRYEEGEAKAIFLLVIEYYLKLNRTHYNLKKDNELTATDLKQLESVLRQLKMGKPIQYILGEASFYGLTFKVNESVLIPRPETEELVGWVIEKMALCAAHSTLNILDIGTGSGCIAIALKKKIPTAEVTALDISSKALITAKENAVLNEVEISFIEQDILQRSLSFPNTPYSILISNPPYITQNEKAEMHEHVLANEPHLALFVSNEKPLIFYEAIADFAWENLELNGLLFFEINEHLGKKVINMLRYKGFNSIELRKDMQGKDRMICCSRS